MTPLRRLFGTAFLAPLVLASLPSFSVLAELSLFPLLYLIVGASVPGRILGFPFVVAMLVLLMLRLRSAGYRRTGRHNSRGLGCAVNCFRAFFLVLRGAGRHLPDMATGIRACALLSGGLDSRLAVPSVGFFFMPFLFLVLVPLLLPVLNAL